MMPSPLMEMAGSSPRTHLTAFCINWLRSALPDRQHVRSTSLGKNAILDLPASLNTAACSVSVACVDRPFLVEMLDTKEQRSRRVELRPLRECGLRLLAATPCHRNP